MYNILDTIIELNKQGSAVYGKLNEAYNTLDRAVGGNLPYGEKPVPKSAAKPQQKFAGPKGNKTFVSGRDKYTDFDSNNPVTEYINEIPDKGMIPLPTVNPTHEALQTAGKYAAGPFGMPFRILRSPGTATQLQKQVDGASVRDGMLYHGLGETNYQKTRFPSNIQGAGIVGQFIGNPKLDNTVEVTEPYDTRNMDYHKTQFAKHLGNLDLINASESVGNMVFRGLDDIGFANKYPRGKTQVIGELKPGHPLYRGGPAHRGSRQ